MTKKTGKNTQSSPAGKKPSAPVLTGGRLPPPLARDDMVKHLQERFPGLTEKEITEMGG